MSPALTAKMRVHPVHENCAISGIYPKMHRMKRRSARTCIKVFSQAPNAPASKAVDVEVQMRQALDWKSAAVRSLLEAGAICGCTEHPDILVRTHDREGECRAFAIATWMLREGLVRAGPRHELMDEVLYRLREISDTCYICDAAHQAS
jgi:hypothetical protein